MAKLKPVRPRKPTGCWVYYLLYNDIIWPCPVHWEWISDFGCWVPFYYAPSMEFIAGEPTKAVRVSRTATWQEQQETIQKLRDYKRNRQH